jgi:hypothetical protein
LRAVFLYNSLSARAIQQLKKIALLAGPHGSATVAEEYQQQGVSMELKQHGRLLNEICFFS